MNHELHRKLVDLYGGRELPPDVDAILEAAAATDAELAHDMRTLRETVDTLRADSGAAFTEESYQRILQRIYIRGGNIQPRAATPAALQYQLPMLG
ncbi:MAG: hypothetical protein SFX74_00255 [Fimbriimonadaceae bacterium]|nr:hypothetical protein [Fimbriimonadaceae bacterium]